MKGKAKVSPFNLSTHFRPEAHLLRRPLPIIRGPAIHHSPALLLYDLAILLPCTKHSFPHMTYKSEEV